MHKATLSSESSINTHTETLITFSLLAPVVYLGAFPVCPRLSYRTLKYRDNFKVGGAFRFVTFNAENLHFNRRPRLIINGLSTHPLSYVEVAQLYLLLEAYSCRHNH